MYQLEKNADPSGTSFQEVIMLDYEIMADIFGESEYGPDDRTSAEWIFKCSETGDIFTVYDYKQTNIAGCNPGLPSIEYFRSCGEVPYHIGSKPEADVCDFVNWLSNKLKGVSHEKHIFNTAKYLRNKCVESPSTYHRV